MTEATRRTAGVRGGPRSAQVVRSVRAAVLAEMMRVGFGGVTIDGVARAAGVNRTTIYRRWPTKAALLGAVIEPLLSAYDSDVDTGSLRADLLAIVLRMRDSAALPEGRAFAEAVRSSSAELRDLVEAVTSRTLAPFHRAAGRAVARGEITDAGRLDAAVHLVYSGLVMWEQTHGEPPTDAACARMIDVALGGAGH